MSAVASDLAATPAPVPPRSRRPSTFGTIYGLVLRLVVSRVRVVMLGVLGLIGVAVAAILGSATAAGIRLDAGTELMNEFGLWLLVPVPTLVFASAALGDPTDDLTLVYLWLRPVARSKIVLAAAAATLTVTWPLVVPALAAGAMLSGDSTDLVIGTVLAATVTMVAYVGIFVALGLRVKRALAWGMLYIFIWEGFVARGSTTAAKIGMRAYGSSILREHTGIELLTSEIDYAWAIGVPLAVGVLALAYATFRLSRQDVA